MQQMLTGAPVQRVLAAVRAALKPERPDAGPAPAGTVTLAQIDVADHPMIRRLYKPSAFLSSVDTAPSYIPAELFAKVLLDRLKQLFGVLAIGADVLHAVQDNLPAAQRAAVAGPLRDALARLDPVLAWQGVVDELHSAGVVPADVLEAIAARTSGTQRAALEEVVRQLRAAPAGAPSPNFASSIWPTLVAIAGTRPLTVDDVSAIVGSGRLPASLAAALRPAIDAANHDLDALRKGIEGWYDNVMDRATGWFRRLAQVWLFVAAAVIVVALNLDTLRIAKQLKNDPAAREAAVQLGTRIAQNGGDAPQIAQQVVFLRTFDDGNWGERMVTRDYESLAMRVQPLLLKSGALVGPMLALQALALRSEAAACTAASPCPPGWTEALNTVIGALCRDTLSLPSAQLVDRTWAAQNSDMVIATSPPPGRLDPCASDRTLVTDLASSPAKTLEALWSSTRVVWNAELGRAAWALRRAPGGPAPNADQLETFRQNMATAVQRAHDELAAVDALAARLEGVGNVKFAIDRWRQAEGCWAAIGAVLASLAGWLITAFMASLGAPLWFDLLTKLTNRRIAGPKPAAPASEG